MSINCLNLPKTAIRSFFYPNFNISISSNTDLDSTYLFIIFLEHIYIVVFAFDVPYEDYAIS